MTIEVNDVQFVVEVTEQVSAGVETNVVEIVYQGLQQQLLQDLQAQVDTLEDTVEAGFAAASGDLAPLIAQINGVEATTDALGISQGVEQAARIAGDNALSASMALIAPPLQADIDAEVIARIAADAGEVVARDLAIAAAVNPVNADVTILEGTIAGFSASISAIGSSQLVLEGTVAALDADFTVLDGSVAALSADVVDVNQAVIDLAVSVAALSNSYFPRGWA